MNGLVKAEGLGKSFLKGEFATSLRDAIRGLFRIDRQKKKGNEVFWALRDVSFEVGSGEAFGVIGPNGAGKSTLLKILARVLKPDEGSIAIEGRLAALIEITAGFHPDLTGRENIFLQGSIMGMNRAETKQKFDDIVDFSGVGDFIDTPMKRFSSGMLVRLGFAVAAFIEPDVFLVDEVLAVGDMSFQQKCLERIDELRQSGTTIVFISHNLSLVNRLCRRGMYLNHGVIQHIGSAESVIEMYRKDVLGGRLSGAFIDEKEGLDHDIRISGLKLLNREGKEAYSFGIDEPMTVKMRYTAKKRIERPTFGIGVHSLDGTHCVGGASIQDGCPVAYVEGDGEAEVTFPNILLSPGIYSVEISIWDEEVLVPYDFRQRACYFEVTGDALSGPLFRIPRKWRVS